MDENPNPVVTHEVAAAFLAQTHTLTIMDAVSATGTRTVDLTPPRPAKPKDMAIRSVTRDGCFPAVGIADTALLYALVNGAVPDTPADAARALNPRPHVYAEMLSAAFGPDEESFFEKFGLDLLSVSEPLAKLGFIEDLLNPPTAFEGKLRRRTFSVMDVNQFPAEPVRVPARADLLVPVKVPQLREAFPQSEANCFLKNLAEPIVRINGPFSWLGTLLGCVRDQGGATLTANANVAEAIIAGIKAANTTRDALQWLYGVICACPSIGAFDFVTDGFWHADHGLPSPGIWPTKSPVPDHLSALIRKGVANGYPHLLRKYRDAKPGLYDGWSLWHSHNFH